MVLWAWCGHCKTDIFQTEVRFNMASDIESLCTKQTLQRLIGMSILHVRVNEGGPTEYALLLESFMFVPVIEASSSFVEFGVAELPGHVLSHSKLDLISILHRKGFVSSSSVTDRFESGSPLEYRAQSVVSGSKLYFACLVLRESVMEKGAPYILHTLFAK